MYVMFKCFWFLFGVCYSGLHVPEYLKQAVAVKYLKNLMTLRMTEVSGLWEIQLGHASLSKY